MNDRLVKFLDSLAVIPIMATAAHQAGFSSTVAHYYIAKSENGDPGFTVMWGGVEGPFHEQVKVALDRGIDRIEKAYLEGGQ
jgi:hypothetical protein